MDSKTNNCVYYSHLQKTLKHQTPPLIKPNETKSEIIVKKKIYKFRFKFNCGWKKSKKQNSKKTFDQNIIANKKKTIMAREGENKVTKDVKVNKRKLNVMIFGRKISSKMLHKIKILMLKRKHQNLLQNRKKIKRLLKKIWKFCECFH